LLPPDGTTVSTVGYGKFGAGCSSSDGLKRWQNYSWGAPPYPTCPGDSGGPHFNAAFPNGLPFAVTGNSGGNGSLVHYRERLFNEMRQLNDFATGAVTSWLPNTLRGGTVHSNAAAATPSDCANLCAANTNCKGWNLLGATCNMLSVVSSWVPTAVSTSGLPTPWQKDSSRGGTVLQNTTAISKSHCASKCGADTNCAGYTHTDSTGACQLYTTTLTAPVTSVGKWSGARRTAHVGVDMPGGDILPPTTTSNAAACGVECAKHAECQSYAWVISTNQCFKKYATPGTTANGNVVSDWKRPVRLPGILFAGTTIGADFEPSPLLDEGCRKACASNGSCVAYSVKLPDYGEAIKCRLFSSVTQELPALTWYDSNYMGLTYF